MSANAAGPVSAAPTLTATDVFQHFVYIPLHALGQAWINSALGRQVDTFINTMAGTYVIGNGVAGTAAHPDGAPGGWLFGDGGAGWDSTEADVAGGNGGAGGLLGSGGRGGAGGGGATGGSGGSGGSLMGVGGAGGAGGSGVDGSAGGAGGVGGDAIGLMFGIGGAGGPGGDGSGGGRGGTGGDGAQFLGSGGRGGDAGSSGVGGDAVGLPALGGAGGNAGLFGAHGAVGKSGLTAGAGQADSPSAPDLTLTTTGTWLTTTDGQVVVLHGLNEVYKIGSYTPAADGFGDDDAAFLAANGFNVVRLGIIWAGLEPEPGVYDTAYLASIGQTVQILAAHGIRTILDMHQDNYSSTFAGEGAPGWASPTGGLPNQDYGFPGSYYLNSAEAHAWDSFWANAITPTGRGLEDEYAQTWEHVAAYFNGTGGVIGYDIMNEPFPGSSWLPTLLGSPFYGYQQLTPMYNQVIAAIRAVDPVTTVYVEPANPAVTEVGDILGLPVNLGAVSDPNVVVAFHDYCGSSATSGICPWIADSIANTVQRYTTERHTPAFMDEFGATDATSDLVAEMGAADRRLFSWTEWAYSGQGDITTSGSPEGESLVFNPALPPTGANVHTSTLATLAAPYPQLISGTPGTWSFANDTWRFSYTTAKVDGSGRFPSGAQTIISVPAAEYPSGYHVIVTGGHVLSDPNSAQLVIAADSGATVVTIAIAAAAAAPQTAA